MPPSLHSQFLASRARARASLLVALAAAFAVSGCSKPEPVAEATRAVRTVTIAADSAGGVLEYAGEVKARTESRLGFRVGGKVLRRNVELGDSVKVGQVLAQLDPQDLRLGSESARAALTGAQANFDLAAADFKRYKDLREQGFIGAAELERRETAVKSAQATLSQALAQASVQGNQANYANLVADAAGVITAVEAEAGTVVAAGTPVVRLAHAGPRDVVFSVPEDKVALVKALAAEPGRFTVRLWGSANAPGAGVLPATIREVAAAADPVTRTFLVKADIGNTAGAGAAAGVQLGQTATVLLALPKTQGVTRLPLSALKEEQGKTIVWLLDKASMTVRQQPVTLSGADGNDAVITAGLKPGQVVVTAGVHVLSPGQKVKLYVDPGAPPSPAAGPATTPVSVQ